jgi:hypothetical protein
MVLDFIWLRPSVKYVCLPEPYQPIQTHAYSKDFVGILEVFFDFD